MSKNLKSRTKKIGLPPGSLVHVGEKKGDQVRLSLIDYTKEKIQQREQPSLETCRSFIEKPSVTWIHVQGIHNAELIGQLGSQVGLHPLVLEDIMSTTQRSKLDDYKDTIFIVIRLLSSENNGENRTVKDEQISLVLGKNFVITFTEGIQDIFAPVIQRLHIANSRIRKRGADFLCYSLVDCIVDQQFLALEDVDEQLDELEAELIHSPAPETLQKIQWKKREISSLRKSIWPLREVISRFQRLDTNLVKETTRLYLHDVYDHTVQAIDTIESFREISSGLLDMYMSTMSQKMNEIMKLLTLVSTIFVPMTFVASIYGMNFVNMPELGWKWGYYITLLIMGAIAGIMFLLFRRKKWI